MKIVLVNGDQEADYLIKMFSSQKGNKIIVINKDSDICKYLSEENKIEVINGNPTKFYDLAISDIEDADIYIALSQDDMENYVSCQIAKKHFHVKKCICNANNPKYVSLFKSLGIDSVISSTFLLSETIKSEASIEDLFKTLTLEDNKIVMLEIKVKKNYLIVGNKLMDIEFPQTTNVSCIYRNTKVIIPNGSTKISAGDKLFIVTTPNSQQEVIDFIQKVK